MILYKYCPWNECTMQNLQNSQLYFNDFASLNDPFELNPIIKKNNDGIYNYKLAGGEINVRTENPDSIITDLNNSTSICSLTTNYNNFLMWAHYAEAHTGICLKFDFKDTKIRKSFHALNMLIPQSTNKIFEDVYEVQYTDIRPNINDELLSLFIFKSKQWSYENEFRLINLTPKKPITYQTECLISIYAGCRMHTENVKTIENILKTQKHHTNLYKMVIDPHEFKLNPQLIDY